MAKFNERLKLLRTEAGLSQQDAAKQLGTSKSSINMYERGEREPGIDMLETIADYFNVDMDFLLGKSEHRSKSAWLAQTERLPPYPGIMPITTQRIPLLGEIACGKPIFCNEDRESYIEVGTNIHADFCLRCKGDSMTGARIFDGDIVFIREQDTVDNGQVAAVIIGDEATLKRVYFYPEKSKLVLQAENAKYEPLVYVGEELSEIHILGKAVAFQSDVI